jgi:hypothetical protein
MALAQSEKFVAIDFTSVLSAHYLLNVAAQSLVAALFEFCFGDTGDLTLKTLTRNAI